MNLPRLVVAGTHSGVGKTTIATGPMAAIFPTRARMQARLAKLGYIEVETCSGLARGHEFRYSTIDPMPENVRRVYRHPAEGYQVHSTLGSYLHLHFLSCPSFAEAFVRRCGEFSQ